MAGTPILLGPRTASYQMPGWLIGTQAHQQERNKSKSPGGILNVQYKSKGIEVKHVVQNWHVRF